MDSSRMSPGTPFVVSAITAIESRACATAPTAAISASSGSGAPSPVVAGAAGAAAMTSATRNGVSMAMLLVCLGCEEQPGAVASQTCAATRLAWCMLHPCGVLAGAAHGRLSAPHRIGTAPGQSTRLRRDPAKSLDRAGDGALAMTSRSPTSSAAADSGSAAPPAPPGGGRPGHRWRRIGLTVALSLLGLVVALVLALQDSRIATALANRLLDRVGRGQGTVLRLERAGGNWLTGFEITGFRMSRHDTLLSGVDTVRARYRLVSLLAGRLDVTEVGVSGLRILTEPPDTTRSRPRKPPLSLVDRLRVGFYLCLPIRIDHLLVRDARWGGRAGAPDSGLRIAPITLEAHQLRLGRGLSFRLDTLAARLASGPDGGG